MPYMALVISTKHLTSEKVYAITRQKIRCVKLTQILNSAPVHSTGTATNIPNSRISRHANKCLCHYHKSQAPGENFMKSRIEISHGMGYEMKWCINWKCALVTEVNFSLTHVHKHLHAHMHRHTATCIRWIQKNIHFETWTLARART